MTNSARSSRRFSFRVRTLLGLVAIVAAGLGFVGKEVATNRRQWSALQALEATQPYDLQYDSTNWTGIALLEPLFGRVTWLSLTGSVGSREFGLLSAFPHLQSLGLSLSTIDTEDPPSFRLPNLTKLDVTMCRELTDDVFARIARGCPRLEELHASDCTLTDAVFPSLCSLKQLRVLDLTGTKIRGQGLDTVARECDQLTELYLGRWPLCHEGTIALSTFAKLTNLKLVDCPVDSPGDLLLLAKCDTLLWLTLWHTGLRDKDIAYLQSKLPKCRITASEDEPWRKLQQ